MGITRPLRRQPMLLRVKLSYIYRPYCLIQPRKPHCINLNIVRDSLQQSAWQARVTSHRVERAHSTRKRGSRENRNDQVSGLGAAPAAANPARSSRNASAGTAPPSRARLAVGSSPGARTAGRAWRPPPPGAPASSRRTWATTSAGLRWSSSSSDMPPSCRAPYPAVKHARLRSLPGR